MCVYIIVVLYLYIYIYGYMGWFTMRYKDMGRPGPEPPVADQGSARDPAAVEQALFEVRLLSECHGPDMRRAAV